MQAFPPKAGAQAGFSLVELMVAITIMLIATGGLVLTSTASRNLVRESEEIDLVTSALQVAAETLLAEPHGELPNTYPVDVPLSGVAEGGIQLRITPDYTNRTGTELPDPLEITLTATWTSFTGRPRSTTVVVARGA